MQGIEWIKPEVFVGSIVYAMVGVLVFLVCFYVVDKATPYRLWEQIVGEKNVALAIVVGSIAISIGLIVAAAIHG